MSTNFYLRRTKPILCFPEFHIGKRSFGWIGTLEGNKRREDLFSFDTERPVVNGLSDIRAAVESGEWEIYDEYETPIDLEDFERHMIDSFDGEPERKRGTGDEVCPDGTGLAITYQSFS